MINEIIVGKKYKVCGKNYHRTPVYIHKNYIMYEHDYCGDDSIECGYCLIDDFKKSVEEIPEAPEEWFEVVYKLKGRNSRPNISDNLYRSKEDFLNYCERKESDYEILKLKKVEL